MGEEYGREALTGHVAIASQNGNARCDTVSAGFGWLGTVRGGLL